MQSLHISILEHLLLLNTINMLSMRISFIFLRNGQLNIFSPLLRCNSPKQNIHLFQTATSRILKEDQDESSHGGTEASEHNECAPANAVDGCRCNFCDDKVEEPLLLR
jgi:hypothetical protein